MKKAIVFLMLFFTLGSQAQSVYSPNREFIFKIEYKDSTSQSVSYLSMWTTDKFWEFDSTQNELFYKYHNTFNKDSLIRAWPYKENIEATGFIENDNKVWLHPPRWNNFAILEYFPFPEVQYGLKCEENYKRYFIGFVDFIDKFKVLKYKMKLNYDSDKYYTISGCAKSKSVKWNVQYRFSKERGFELMLFEYGEKTRIQLELIDIIEH